MSEWSIDQVPPQPGRVAIVTGANSGIGYQTALGLARKDVEVILACQNTEKAEEAKRTITREYPRA